MPLQELNDVVEDGRAFGIFSHSKTMCLTQSDGKLTLAYAMEENEFGAKFLEFKTIEGKYGSSKCYIKTAAGLLGVGDTPEAQILPIGSDPDTHKWLIRKERGNLFSLESYGGYLTANGDSEHSTALFGGDADPSKDDHLLWKLVVFVNEDEEGTQDES